VGIWRARDRASPNPTWQQTLSRAQTVQSWSCEVTLNLKAVTHLQSSQMSLSEIVNQLFEEKIKEAA